MNYFFSKILHLIFFILVPFVYVSDGHESVSSKVLLISLDGFRQDYFVMAEKNGVDLKFFKRIFHKGIKADHINNLFITRTFPNHMSIITGCYEETHGLIDNAFFDPLYNESFSMKNFTQSFQSKWFSEVEPIWVTNQRNGHQSAIMYWPGQLAPYKDVYYPSYSFGVYNPSVSFERKIDVMLDWMTKKSTTLGVLYHPHPDREGHKYGPNSSAVIQAVSSIDYSLGYLLTKIEKLGLADSLNVIIVSDHGMNDITEHKKVIMDDFLNRDLYYNEREESLTMWGIWPRDNTDIAMILFNLRKVLHITAYSKQKIPIDWHYSANRRVAPIIVVANPGWVLVHTDNDSVTDRGAHGYPISRYVDQGVFIAWGPSIAVSNRLDIVVREIDVAPLIAEILSLDYRPLFNGSVSRIRWILNGSNGGDDSVFSSLIMVCVLALLCALAVCIVISCAHYHAKSVHIPKVSQTYALQTGKLMRQRSNSRKNRKGMDWIKLNRNTKKKPKTAAADTAFLLESSSENDDDILADVNVGATKFAS